jgi:hypothetical protein
VAEAMGEPWALSVVPSAAVRRVLALSGMADRMPLAEGQSVVG